MHNPPLILIVDDKETNREILRARLRAQGYELLEAGDGEVALSIAQQQHPDLILLDVLMPKIDGVDRLVRTQFTKTRRSRRGRNSAPIVGLAANVPRLPYLISLRTASSPLVMAHLPS